MALGGQTCIRGQVMDCSQTRSPFLYFNVSCRGETSDRAGKIDHIDGDGARVTGTGFFVPHTFVTRDLARPAVRATEKVEARDMADIVRRRVSGGVACRRGRKWGRLSETCKYGDENFAVPAPSAVDPDAIHPRAP